MLTNGGWGQLYGMASNSPGRRASQSSRRAPTAVIPPVLAVGRPLRGQGRDVRVGIPDRLQVGDPGEERTGFGVLGQAVDGALVGRDLDEVRRELDRRVHPGRAVHVRLNPFPDELVFTHARSLPSDFQPLQFLVFGTFGHFFDSDRVLRAGLLRTP